MEDNTVLVAPQLQVEDEVKIGVASVFHFRVLVLCLKGAVT
jgi:hypothetical protein